MRSSVPLFGFHLAWLQASLALASQSKICLDTRSRVSEPAVLSAQRLDGTPREPSQEPVPRALASQTRLTLIERRGAFCWRGQEDTNRERNRPALSAAD